MPNIKVKVITEFKQLAGILDMNDEVTIVPTLSTEPKLIHHAWVKHAWDNEKKNWEVVHTYCPESIAPIGSYEGYTFKAKNGKTYNDTMLVAQIGHVPLEKIFMKV